MDGREEESWLWCLFCKAGSASLGATAALPAPLPGPPAQPCQRQVMKQLDRSPPYLPLDALPLHFQEIISQKASRFLVSRTGTSEMMVLMVKAGLLKGPFISCLFPLRPLLCNSHRLAPGEGSTLKFRELGEASPDSRPAFPS